MVVSTKYLFHQFKEEADFYYNTSFHFLETVSDIRYFTVMIEKALDEKGDPDFSGTRQSQLFELSNALNVKLIKLIGLIEDAPEATTQATIETRMEATTQTVSETVTVL